MSMALFFLLVGFILGFVLSQALDRAEQGSPSRSPRSRPVRTSPPLGPRSASSHPSNVRRVFDDPPRKPDGSSYYLWDLAGPERDQ